MTKPTKRPRRYDPLPAEYTPARNRHCERRDDGGWRTLTHLDGTVSEGINDNDHWLAAWLPAWIAERSVTPVPVRVPR